MSWAALVDRYHKHPMFVLVLALAFSGFVLFSLKAFAFVTDLVLVEQRLTAKISAVESEIDDVDVVVGRIQGEIGGIRDMLEIWKWEERIHNYESDIWNLENKVDSGAATEEELERLSRLRSELGTAKRMLSRIN